MTCKVLIFGSCVSRDVFNLPDIDKGSVILVDYFARSSFASIMTSPYSESVKFDDIPSRFQIRAVKRDFNKSFVTDLKKIDFDILLIDLIDERFHLLNRGETTITRSGEFVSSNMSLKGFTLIDCCSDDYYKYWVKGWDAFLKLATVNRFIEKIRINEVYWSKKIVDDSIANWIYTDEVIDKNNKFLSKLYKKIREDLSQNQIYSYTSKELSSAKEHKWGQSPFHYTREFYNRSLKLILKENSKVNALENIRKVNEKFNLNEKSVISDANKKLIGKFLKESFLFPKQQTLDLGSEQFIEVSYYLPEKDVNNNKFDHVLVCFSAAVGDREHKTPPFFSGKGIAESTNLPLVSIADPAVSKNSQLGLGWYAGDENHPCLQIHIKYFLEKLANKYNAKLILFGGSGGGFATLVQAHLLSVPATVLIWNPQTSFLNYLKCSVDSYRKTSFRSDFSAKKNDFYKTLQRLGIIYNLTSKYMKNNINVIYLQNQSDWHVERHAIPFMIDGVWSRIGGGSFLNQNNNQIMHYGNWGRGHIQPNSELIMYVIREIVRGAPLVRIIRNLDFGRTAYGDKTPYFELSSFSEKTVFQIKSQLIGTKISIKITSEGKGILNRYLRYSFSMYIDDEVIESISYQDEGTCEFIFPTHKNKVMFSASIQDELGTVKKIFKDIIIIKE